MGVFLVVPVSGGTAVAILISYFMVEIFGWFAVPVAVLIGLVIAVLVGLGMAWGAFQDWCLARELRRVEAMRRKSAAEKNAGAIL
jgi:uncharacterized membrane protein YgaE (UPF0421/DUF939 family)